MQAATQTMARAYSPARLGTFHRRSRRRCRNPTVATSAEHPRTTRSRLARPRAARHLQAKAQHVIEPGSVRDDLGPGSGVPGVGQVTGASCQPAPAAMVRLAAVNAAMPFQGHQFGCGPPASVALSGSSGSRASCPAFATTMRSRSTAINALPSGQVFKHRCAHCVGGIDRFPGFPAIGGTEVPTPETANCWTFARRPGAMADSVCPSPLRSDALPCIGFVVLGELRENVVDFGQIEVA